jgi:hypothetical protein
MCKKSITDQKSESQNIEEKSDQKLKPQDILNNAINIAILISVLIATGSLIFTVVKFCVNENIMLNEMTQTLNTLGDSISNPSHGSNKMVELRMEYLDRISQMHKQASSSDLFVFMYGFLSSVLIGVSAYLIKKGESQVGKINDKVNTSVDALKKKADDVDDLIKLNRKNIQGLTDSYASLNADAQKIKIIIDNNKSTIMLNYLLMLLSDSLFMLINYRSSQDQNIEYLVRFNQNIKQLENISLLNVNELSSKTYIGKLMQMVGNVRTVYEEITEDPKYSIDVDVTNQSNTQKYLGNIVSWLRNMSDIQQTTD